MASAGRAGPALRRRLFQPSSPLPAMNKTPPPASSPPDSTPLWRPARRDFLRAGGLALLGISCPPAALAAARKPAKLRFGMVTDLHYADADPRGTRFYRQSRTKLAEAVQRLTARAPHFAIELGDFKDQGHPPREAQTVEFLKTIEAEFQKFPVPVYHVPGNHDFDNISLQLYLANIRNAGRPAARSWYSFDSQGLHCIVLDNNFRSDGRHYDHGRFDWKDANLPPEELDWLKADLAGTNNPALVFSHQLLDGAGPVFVKNAPAVRSILEESDRVLAVFQGHHHPGRYSRIHGIHYYTLKAMVEGSGPENNSYALVEVFPSGDILVTGYRKAAGKRLPRRPG